MGTAIDVKTPVARMVRGSLYEPNTTDSDGAPLVHKHGALAGQPRVQYFFAIAIPKEPGKHWAETEWGAKLWNLGHTCFPGVAAAPTFAWKIDDGDSQIPNTNGRKPCDNEGYPGNWVMRLSNGFAPKIFRQENGAFVLDTDPNLVKPGYYIEVLLSADGNGSTKQPGIYLNPSLVCFRGVGPEISFGPNVNEVGFGVAPLPAGASAIPLPSTGPLPVAPPPAAVAVAPPPAAVAVAPPPAVQPDRAFLNVAPPPAAVAVRPMTPKAGGVPYEEFIKMGWTDAQLIQNGFMAG